MDHADWADPILLGQFYDDQLSGSLLFYDRWQGYDGNSKAHLYSSFDRLDVVELGNFLNLDTMGLENPVGRFSRWRVAFEEDHVDAVQVPGAHLFLFRESVFRG